MSGCRTAHSFERWNRASLLATAILALLCFQADGAVAQSNQTSPLGTNLAGVNYYSSEQPFLNMFKQGSGWFGNVTNGTHYDEIQGVFNLDANGYPQTMTAIGSAAGQTFTEIDTLLLRNLGISGSNGQSAPFYPAGNYVFLYAGTGTFNFYFDCLNSNIVSSAAGRIVINIPTPSPNGCQIGISSMGSGTSYPHNIALVYSPDSTSSNIGVNETLYNNGEIFNPTFINLIAGFKTLRFMDWMQTNQTVQSNWSGRPLPSQAFWGIQPGGNVDPMPQGVPIEVMVALCNKINADGWFNMPPLSTDDYVTQFATLVHSSLNTNLKAYVEYGNEIWNNGALLTFNQLIPLGEAAFPSYDSAWGAAFYYGLLRAVQNGATWKSVWGADANRVIRVVGGQNGYTYRNQFILQFTAGMYGGNPSNFSGTVAQNVDALAVAPYFGYPVPDTFTLDQLFTEIMSGGLVSSANGGYPGGMIKQTLDWATTNYSTASSYGLALVAYEGGQTLVDYSGSDAALQTLYAAANRDPRMGTAYTTYLNGWKGLGGTLFINFSDIIQQSKYGYWGVLENVLQTSSPKYNALTSFIASTPCWWSGCSGSGTTTPPPPSPVTTPPSVPTGLAGVAASTTQIGLAWNASTDTAGTVAGYNVYRNGQKVGAASKTAYQDGGLSAGTAYQYSVSAYDTSGNTSAQSSAVTVATPAPPPTPPIVAINSPVNGATIKNNGAINIASSATSSSGVASIAITVDSGLLTTCTNTTSCSASWMGKSISRGTHTIGATATDIHGLQASTAITIVDLK